MAKDPAFLFYPGDYLRDTQNLSEKSQVAYDRIMCEHMRNICEDMNKIVVTKKQVDFFIKRLNEDEIEELMFVLSKINGDFQIEWVAESIAKRKTYSNSRSKNREGKLKKHIKTYDPHMENENENENINKKDIEITKTNKEILLESETWHILVSKTKKKSLDFVKNKIKDFVSDQELKDELNRDIKELKNHFINWLEKQPKEETKSTTLPMKLGIKK